MTVFSRRVLLAGAGSVLLGGALTGCTLTDPVVHGGNQTPPPLPTPNPVPTLADVSGALQREADLAAAMEDLSRADGVSADLREQATPLAMGHRAHLVALASPDPVARPTALPTGGPGTPRPVPSPSITSGGGTDQAARVNNVQSLLTRAAEDYRARALATEGQQALLWASLHAYAIGAQSAVQNRQTQLAPATEPRPLQVWSDVEAMQQVVRQVHALIFGYQAALAPMTGEDSRTVTRLLNERRSLRTRLSDLLRERNEQVPAAEAAYQLPTEPTDRAAGARIIATMESAFRPFAGGWVAAATDASTRELALNTLQESASTAGQWGADLPIWPGWPN